MDSTYLVRRILGIISHSPRTCEEKKRLSMPKKPTAAAAAPGPSGGMPPMPRAKRGIRQYFVDVGREMKKVTWPAHTETNRLTGVVLAVCTLLILILTGFHLVFKTLIDILTKAS